MKRSLCAFVGQAEERYRMDLVGFRPQDLIVTAGGVSSA